VDLLDIDGELIIITPNLIDPLKDIWKNLAFTNFFYDEHAVNYFSPKAINKLMACVRSGNISVSTRQGYSFANHLSWYLTNAPRTTGVVGGDNYTKDILARLNNNSEKFSLNSKAEAPIANGLVSIIKDFDSCYKKYLEDHGYGNQIRVTYSRAS
jgi:hypothetical protein